MSKHLLLIEDEAHLAFSLEFNLQQEGYTVQVAETLHQARDILKEKTPDLIILDVMLPDGTGFDFCAELRERFADVVFHDILREPPDPDRAADTHVLAVGQRWSRNLAVVTFFAAAAIPLP